MYTTVLINLFKYSLNQPYSEDLYTPGVFFFFARQYIFVILKLGLHV